VLQRQYADQGSSLTTTPSRRTVRTVGSNAAVAIGAFEAIQPPEMLKSAIKKDLILFIEKYEVYATKMDSQERAPDAFHTLIEAHILENLRLLTGGTDLEGIELLTHLKKDIGSQDETTVNWRATLKGVHMTKVGRYEVIDFFGKQDVALSKIGIEADFWKKKEAWIMRMKTSWEVFPEALRERMKTLWDSKVYNFLDWDDFKRKTVEEARHIGTYAGSTGSPRREAPSPEKDRRLKPDKPGVQDRKKSYDRKRKNSNPGDDPQKTKKLRELGSVHCYKCAKLGHAALDCPEMQSQT
jgi:hypothetical protein